jgi:hypothetical protein
MDINEMKSNWKNVSASKRTAGELAVMTTVHKHPQLRRILVKLCVESVLLLLFLGVYYDALDGDKRPQWLNVIFIGSVLLYILNDVIGFFNILRLTRGPNVLLALRSLEGRLWTLKVFSLVSSLVFGLSLIALLSFGIALTAPKIAILFAMVMTLLVFVYRSYRTWNYRIGRVSESIAGFER